MKRDAEDILKDLVEEICEYNSLRDDELEFNDTHDSPDFWNEDTDKLHEKLLEDILTSRKRVFNLLQEATDGKVKSF